MWGCKQYRVKNSDWDSLRAKWRPYELERDIKYNQSDRVSERCHDDDSSEPDLEANYNPTI